MDSVCVHYHDPSLHADKPGRRWACGAMYGQATGEPSQVTCEECKEFLPPPPPVKEKRHAKQQDVPLHEPEVPAEGPREILVFAPQAEVPAVQP